MRIHNTFRRLLAIGAASLLGLTSALGVPACPEPCVVSQPDGTQVTLYLHGDEFMNFTTTTDGYTVVRDKTGAYVYARVTSEGKLASAGMQAHDPQYRTAAEKLFLSSVQPRLRPAMSPQQQQMRSDRSMMAAAVPGFEGQQPRGLYDYHRFRGLVILVEFNDCSFSYTNAHEIFGDMVTGKNYTGYMSQSQIPEKIPYTGSVRDYFYDNSSGLFDPQFDIVGPVKIDMSMYSPNQTSNMQTVMKRVVAAADSEVDFSKYDTDGDGMVDMFYVIFAGGGSNFSGNDSRLVWPHAWNLSSFYVRADNVYMGRYACSTELYGAPATGRIDGIGTICHEFSHVLGLMDEYDTDYESTGGESVHPGKWSVMAGGSYLNFARTPVGYSLFQRYQSGFTVPQEITDTGLYVLRDIDASNHGYRINSPDPREYFLLENRRKAGNKWNCYGPGEGMLVFRVDSTSTSVWSSNKINVDPSHNYYELLRANPKSLSGKVTDSDGDPFPGSGNVTALKPDGMPAFKTWGGMSPSFMLDSITEHADGSISFMALGDNTERLVETFEDVRTEGKNDVNVTGKFCRWSFSNASVVSPKSEFCNGVKAVELFKNSTLQASEIKGYVTSVSFTLRNTSTRSSMMRLVRVMPDGSKVAIPGSDGSNYFIVSGNSEYTASFPMDKVKSPVLMLEVQTGSSDDPIYLDDFAVQRIQSNGIVSVLTAASGALTAEMSGNELRVSGAAGPVSVYDVYGMLRATISVTYGCGSVQLPQGGIYIVSDGRSTVKVF